MTIGATTSFQSTRDEICTDALVNLGAVAPGKDASAARTAGLLTHAARALNRLVKSLDAEGEFLWRIARRTTTLTAGNTRFLPSTDVLDIDGPLAVTRVGQDQSTVMVPMSRDDYMSIPDRNSEGLPTRYYVEKTLDQITVYFHPACDESGMSIEYPVFTRSADFVSGTDTPDFFPKWTACLVYGLTAELAASYGQPGKIQIFRDLYQQEKDKLLSDDNEKQNLILVPFGRMTY